MDKPMTDKQKWEAIIDVLIADLERESPEDIDKLLRDVGIDPVKLEEHYQDVADAAMKERRNNETR